MCKRFLPEVSLLAPGCSNGQPVWTARRSREVFFLGGIKEFAISLLDEERCGCTPIPFPFTGAPVSLHSNSMLSSFRSWELADIDAVFFCAPSQLYLFLAPVW